MYISRRTQPRFLLLAAVLVLLGLDLVSWSLASDKWEIDDILLAEQAGEFQFSPDAAWVVWVKSQLDKEKDRTVSNLFLSSLKVKKEIQLTRGTDINRSPKWSPDGTQIAFLSSRSTSDSKVGAEEESDEGAGLWLMSLHGGDPWPALEQKRKVLSFEWQDNNHIVFMAAEDPALYELEKKVAKDTSQVVEDAENEPPNRLFLLTLADKSVKRITRNREWMQEFVLSPDGKWAAAVLNRSLSFAFDHLITPSLVLIRIENGEIHPVEPDRRLVTREVAWAPDSSGFYYSRDYSTHPVYFTASVLRLSYFDVTAKTAQEVKLSWDWGIGGTFEATADGFIALLADGRRFRPARYRKSGGDWTKEDLAGIHQKNIWDWKLARDGRSLVYSMSTASLPDQWFQAEISGAEIRDSKQLTDLNPSFRKKLVMKTEMVQWKGARGDTVEGILYYPMNYEAGKRYPLMHSIHGGPTGTDFDMWAESWVSPRTLLTQKGSFVLETNYHGSTNYGLEWVESICCGNYYELERVDLEKGVDYLIERGLVDPDRLGSMGWSNGSILTTELITRSRRYKVASAGAGDVEWISDWGNVMFGASFDNYYFGKPPYEDPDTYVRKSPYFRLKDVTTPTIIYTGTDDVNVPPSQSWSHFRVMQQATKTPVRFLLFPGEPHGFRKYTNQRRKMEEDMAWFDLHFFQTTVLRNPSVKKQSPLDTTLKLASAVRTGLHYGEQTNGVLVPETVSFGSLKVGRFEVTNAQFAAFDPSHQYGPLNANFPAGGIPFERAQAYVKWLSEKTGRTYRLPKPEETAVLYTAGKESENTLDHWAGYSPNPEDTVKLLEAARSLPGDAPLLTEVGRFIPRDDDSAVFDLGGNAAEWTVSADGTGKPAGGCAVCPRESKEPEYLAPVAYRGIRVILEQ